MKKKVTIKGVNIEIDKETLDNIKAGAGFFGLIATIRLIWIHPVAFGLLTLAGIIFFNMDDIVVIEDDPEPENEEDEDGMKKAA